MSSPISPVLADDDALLAAAVDVAENSLFALADACDAATFADAALASADGGDAWLSAAVDFNGPMSGRVEVTLPEPLARHLAAAFAGLDTPEDIGDGELVDFSGELANMVCGTWLTRACRHETFSLEPPQVRRGQPDPAAAANAVSRYLSIDETPVRVALSSNTALSH
jgi:hypothetical protein